MKKVFETTLLLLAVLAFTFTACNSPAQDATQEAASETAAATTDDGAKATLVSEKGDGAGISIGDKAPAFNLKGVDGQMYSFENIKDANGETPKGYIVTFTCNTCPVATAYEDRLIELHNKMSPKGYPVVAIMPNSVKIKPGDSYEAMQQRAKKKGFPFLYLIDDKQEIFPQYGATKTPEIYLVDSDLILQYHGAIDDNSQDAAEVTVNYVEKAVSALEKGEKVDPAQVKAIGCSIKV